MSQSYWFPILPSAALSAAATARQSVSVRVHGHLLHVARDAASASGIAVTDRSGGLAGRRWATAIVNQLVFVWSGEDEPCWQIEALPELSEPRWTPVRWRRLGPFRASAHDVMRDVVDNGHFEPIHGLIGAETRAWREGPLLRTVSRGHVGIPLRAREAAKRALAPRGTLELDGCVHGPYLLSYRGTLSFGLRLRHILLSAVVPVDATTIELLVGVSIRRIPAIPSVLITRRLLRELERDYLADADLWQNIDQRPDFRSSDPETAAEEARLLGVFDKWWASFEFVPEPNR